MTDRSFLPGVDVLVREPDAVRVQPWIHGASRGVRIVDPAATIHVHGPHATAPDLLARLARDVIVHERSALSHGDLDAIDDMLCNARAAVLMRRQQMRDHEPVPYLPAEVTL